MNERLLELRQRRGKLLGIIAAQRETLTESVARWRYPLAILDKAWSFTGYLRNQPLLVSAVVALVVIRRRSLFGLLKWSLVAWRGYRYLDAIKSRLTTGKDGAQRL